MVQRYDVDSPSVCFEAEDGYFVKYEDYAALEKRHTALLKLVQMAYDAPISAEGMHWVHQAVNNLEDWLND